MEPSRKTKNKYRKHMEHIGDNTPYTRLQILGFFFLRILIVFKGKQDLGMDYRYRLQEYEIGMVSISFFVSLVSNN